MSLIRSSKQPLSDRSTAVDAALMDQLCPVNVYHHDMVACLLNHAITARRIGVATQHGRFELTTGRIYPTTNGQTVVRAFCDFVLVEQARAAGGC